jgi:hypothetical protein
MKNGFSWVVREGDEGDLEGIFSLRRIAFGEIAEEKLEEKFWRWELEEGLIKAERSCDVVPYGLPITKKNQTMKSVNVHRLRIPR